MKINWKEVASSAGYKLMKAAVAKQYNNRFTNDDRFAEAFNFAINRAKQNIYVACWLDNNDYTDDLILKLDEWERKRKQSFLSFYSEYNLPKKSSRVLKTPGIRSRIKYYKQGSWYKNSNKATVELSEHLQRKRTKKTRWTNERKVRACRYRQLSL